ncbi:MAG TPA: efflux RND transporter periplasmic adaptor subunit [Methylomirabilota bacterium]|nr:efflux RND transporter periplasmic adaptor subunit [Methylomirabilota bacterium]
MDDQRTEVRRRTVRWGRVAGIGVAAVAILALGVAAGVAWSERRAERRDPGSARSQAGPEPSRTIAPVPAPAETDAEPVEVSLTPEAMKRAGIATAPVWTDLVESITTVPATVAPNAYRETKVNSLVGGIVRQVRPELGAQVARGETLAVIFSNELAEGQMKYLSMQAMLQADHQKLTRTRKLAEIGAASRQEVEEVTAIHEAHATEVAAARQRLLLLGLTPSQVGRLQDASHIVSEVVVVSPGDGTILARNVNPGQVVGAGQELLTVADLGTVWVIGDLYEKDFGDVRVGTPASVRVPAGSGAALRGRVAYIDPRVDPATRTAKVRVEVPNPRGSLRLGMFVQMTFQVGVGERRALLPRAAVQSIGSRTVVYVATDEEGRFVETPVTLGAPMGDAVQVLAGVKPGDKVVTEGSFFLRAEAARVRSSG